jgi:hypothetical protein
MSELAGTLTTNGEDVAAKVIDGELIIIRLSDGTYYSMDNVGTAVWEMIEGRATVPAIVREIATRYGAPVSDVESDVSELVRELIVEKLVVSADGPPPTPSPGEVTTAGRYSKPRLNIYRDMGNLLALDPPTPGIDDLSYDAKLA